MKSTSLVKDLFFVLLVCVINFSTVFAQRTPPREVRHLYSSLKDMNVSDDFNSIDWKNKWTWRRGMGDSAQIHIEIQKDTFVCIKGDAKTKFGSGLSSLHSTKYGFYVTKWRLQGITNGKQTPWHPSIWAAIDNFGVRTYKLDPKPYRRLEIDLMESFWVPNWSSHVIPWTGDGGSAHFVKPKNPKMPTKDWSILGFEYTPKYVAFWEFLDGEWKFVESIPFGEGPTVKGKNINYGHRQRVYWILSNIFIKDKDTASPDSYLQVDYFYYYPFTFYPSYYWKD